MLGERVQSGGALGEESPVQHGSGRGRLRRQHPLGYRLQQRHVAADPDVQELVGELDARADQSAGTLRVLESLESRLGQRVDRDDRGAVPLRFLQGDEHARVVGAGVLAHDDDQVGLREVVVADAGLADADRLRERDARRLVAHVRAVGQVVRAETAHEQLVHVGGFVAGPARGVEDRVVRVVQGVELAGDDVERVVPADRLVVVAAGRLVHRLGEPALLAEPVLASLGQIAERVLGPERRVDAFAVSLPGDGLRAVLAEAHPCPLGRVRPRAGHAVEAVLLVDAAQDARRAHRAGLLQGVLHGVQHTRQARRRGLWFADVEPAVVDVVLRRPALRHRFIPSTAADSTVGSTCRRGNGDGSGDGSGRWVRAMGQSVMTRQLLDAVATSLPAESRTSPSAKATRRPGRVTQPCARSSPLVARRGRR